MVAFRNGPVGPAPDPSALRRNGRQDVASWTRLPGRGLREAPGWPTEGLDPENMPDERVFAYWDRIWTEYPQAHIWKRQRMEMQVAAYCRLAVLCASATARSTTLTMFKQLGQELLITPHAMRAARVIIDEQIEDVVEEVTTPLGIAPVIQITGGTHSTSGSVLDRLRSPSAAATDDEEDDDDLQDEDDEVEDDDDGE